MSDPSERRSPALHALVVCSVFVAIGAVAALLRSHVTGATRLALSAHIVIGALTLAAPVFHWRRMYLVGSGLQYVGGIALLIVAYLAWSAVLALLGTLALLLGVGALIVWLLERTTQSGSVTRTGNA